MDGRVLMNAEALRPQTPDVASPVDDSDTDFEITSQNGNGIDTDDSDDSDASTLVSNLENRYRFNHSNETIGNIEGLVIDANNLEAVPNDITNVTNDVTNVTNNIPNDCINMDGAPLMGWQLDTPFEGVNTELLYNERF
jgi:hypothetical protein